jgi:pimeloyl-[acyl-carrier protein] methyl ester esterase
MADAPARPPLVFLHGWTMEGRIFAEMIGRLSGAFECHAPDLPGHGASEDGFPLDIDGCADFVANFLERHELRKPVLVGWSLGAMVAWNLTRRHPDIALSGTVAIDMSPKIVNGPHWHLGIRNFEARQNERTLAAIAADWSAFAARVNGGMYAAGTSEPHPETLAIIRRKNPTAMAALWASLAEADERETLKRLASPLLVIKGAKSRLYPPETGRFVAEHAPKATLLRYENSGHSPHLEEPARFAEALSGWIDALVQDG